MSRRSLTSVASRPADSLASAMYSRATSGNPSQSAASSSIQLMPDSGVRSWWLTNDTKSDFMRSASFCVSVMFIIELIIRRGLPSCSRMTCTRDRGTRVFPVGRRKRYSAVHTSDGLPRNCRRLRSTRSRSSGWINAFQTSSDGGAPPCAKRPANASFHQTALVSSSQSHKASFVARPASCRRSSVWRRACSLSRRRARCSVHARPNPRACGSKCAARTRMPRSPSARCSRRSPSPSCAGRSPRAPARRGSPCRYPWRRLEFVERGGQQREGSLRRGLELRGRVGIVGPEGLEDPARVTGHACGGGVDPRRSRGR